MRDALRAAQVVPAFRAAIVAASGRDQPGAAGAAAADAGDDRRADDVASDASTRCRTARPSSSPTNSSTRCRSIRRSSRSTAGTSAWSGSTATASWRSASPRADPAVRPAAAARACATRRSARSSNGAPTTSRSRLGRRAGAPGRRGAGHRLRPRRERAPATRCRRSARTPSPIRWSAPGAVDLTAHVDFQALARAAESMGAQRPRAGRAGATSCAVSASRSAPPRCKASRAAGEGGRDRRRGRRG